MEKRDISVGEELERILEGHEYMPLTLEFGEGLHLFLNPLRRALFIYLLHRPCTSLTTIGRHFKKGINAIKWHLTAMMDAGIIECFNRPRKRKRYYVKGYLSQSDIMALYCLNSQRKLEFYRTVAHNPGITLRAVAKEIHVLPPVAVRLKAELKTAGLIDTIKAGRNLHIYATDLLRKRIEHFTYDDSDIISAVMTILRKDGMMPELIAKTKEDIRISIQGIEKRYIITVPRNPYSYVLKEISL